MDYVNARAGQKLAGKVMTLLRSMSAGSNTDAVINIVGGELWDEPEAGCMNSLSFHAGFSRKTIKGIFKPLLLRGNLF